MTRELTLASAIHLAAVLPALAIGVAQLLLPKGTRSHKAFGWAWVAAMAIAAVSSFWIFGINSGGRFSVIHLLSVFVLLSQSRQVARDRVRGDIEYDINLKAELEIAHLHEKVDHMHAEILARLDAIKPTKRI